VIGPNLKNSGNGRSDGSFHRLEGSDDGD
jgi:hypothetical protein